MLYGDGTPELATISTKKPQVTAVQVQMSSPFGTHHTYVYQTQRTHAHNLYQRLSLH